MWKSFSPSREVITTIPCVECRTALIARRSCHMAWLHCPACARDSDLKEYIGVMDERLERFLEEINCDRI